MFHADAELSAWGIAVTVWLGFLIGAMAELYLRTLEWEVRDLREELEKIRREGPWRL